jgi:catechol 2,3-dioxygenase-like lactoylglutathione lyase family enzyme
MLDKVSLHPTLPASDIERAKAWYEEKLGLKPVEENPGGVTYETGGQPFSVYPTQFAGTAQNTAAEFSVDDLDATIDWLAGRGVVFEQYDFPGMKTDEKGVVDLGGIRAAWFKDSEGNILALTQLSS